MKLFRSKKQEEEIKKPELLEASRTITTELKLSQLTLNFNLTQVKPYYAYLRFQERPSDYQNHGMEDGITLYADNFPELVDKVTEYLGR